MPESLKAFFKRHGDLLKKVLRYTLQGGIIGYLLYQLYDLGFQKIIESLPINPWFYILYLLIYFSLPVMEVFIYRIKWPIDFKSSLPVFIQKKVLNTDVVGYSGELYLYYWAKTQLNKTSKQVFHFVKDNNILSSIASTFITLCLLAFFITQGYIDVRKYMGEVSALNWLFIVLVLGITGGIIYRFRKTLFSMNRSDSLKIFSLHAFRIVVINVLQIIQWKVGRPEIALPVWFTFSAVQILSSRIPFLPSTDALFVSVALEMSDMVAVSKASLVGILTANLILKRIMNVLSFMLSSYLKKKNPVEITEEDKQEFESLSEKEEE